MVPCSSAGVQCALGSQASCSSLGGSAVVHDSFGDVVVQVPVVPGGSVAAGEPSALASATLLVPTRKRVRGPPAGLVRMAAERAALAAIPSEFAAGGCLQRMLRDKMRNWYAAQYAARAAAEGSLLTFSDRRAFGRRKFSNLGKADRYGVLKAIVEGGQLRGALYALAVSNLRGDDLASGAGRRSLWLKAAAALLTYQGPWGEVQRVFEQVVLQDKAALVVALQAMPSVQHLLSAARAFLKGFASRFKGIKLSASLELCLATLHDSGLVRLHLQVFFCCVDSAVADFGCQNAFLLWLQRRQGP